MDLKEEKLKERICPICLHNWNDPTVLDNCKHIFCFECIIEWTRLKPECPLCKCALESLKHRLSVSEDLLPRWQLNGQIENIVELRSEYEMNQIMKVTMNRPPEVERHAIVQVAKSLMGELHSLRSLSITTYASESIYRRAISEIDKELTEYRHLIGKIAGGVSRADLFNEPAFRRIIYKKNLMPNSICTPLFNVTFNKDYVRSHREAVKFHILPFVVREMMALMQRDELDIDTCLNQLLDYFSSNIKRQAIVTFLSKRGIENPHQFLNNLLHFASSGQTLKVYDQNSEYTQRRTNYIGDFMEDDDVLVLNSNSDVEVIGERNNRRQQQQPGAGPGPSTRANEHAAFNNNLLFQQQQQPSSSHQAMGTGGSPPDFNNTSGDLTAESMTHIMRQMMNSINQSMNQQRQQQPLPDYFYTAPMHGPRPHQRDVDLRQQQQQQDEEVSSSNSRRRHHDNADDPVVLDDSDDAVQYLATTKKRRDNLEEEEEDDNDGDETSEMMLLDETNDESSSKNDE